MAPEAAQAKPDRRINAYRPDLADAGLRGQVEAQRFVEGRPRQVTAPNAPIRKAPDPLAEQEAEALYGERVRVFEDKNGWSWLQSERDGYVGYVESGRLGTRLWNPTHRVAVPRTPLFSGPGLKTAVTDFLHMESALEISAQENGYARTEEGWVYAGHLAPEGEQDLDYVSTALLFLGAPYVWGGRSSLGLDCSGLAQLALQRAGIACPRDSDMQAASPLLGERLPPGETPRRGDLIYWKGHVAIALDAATVVNATAHGLAVVVEPLAELDARARSEHPQGILVIRRPQLLGAAASGKGN
jgi:cell wall-associated NlpC family hydrolase